jgi:hypothetical protein
MERREFFTKLIRSLFIITGVAASGFVLSDQLENSAESCPPGKECDRCQSAGSCGLPSKKQKASFVGPPKSPTHE